MNRKLWFVFLAIPLIAGCSVGMALSGKEQKDTSVLATGVSRDSVVSRLGPPQTSVTDSDGTLIDTWDIVKGNSPSAGRAVAHGAMDFLTLGLWEVIGTPVELATGQEKHSIYTVRYDKENKVSNLSVSEENRSTSQPAKTDTSKPKGTTVSAR